MDTRIATLKPQLFLAIFLQLENLRTLYARILPNKKKPGSDIDVTAFEKKPSST